MYESAKPVQQFGWSMKNRVVLREELTVVNIGCTKTFNCNYLSSQGNFIQYQELNKTVNRREPILELGIIQRFVVEHGLNKEQLQHYSFTKETITTTTNNNHYFSSSKLFCWTITPSRFVEQLHPAILLNNYTQLLSQFTQKAFCAVQLRATHEVKCTKYRISIVLLVKHSTFVSSAWSFCLFSSPPQWPITFDFQGFFPSHICPILILEKEPVFSFLMLSDEQGNYWYLFYNVFGTRSLTGIEPGTSRTESKHSTTRL